MDTSNRFAQFAPADAVSIIVGEFEKAGCRQTKETKKVTEFATPRGQTVYLVKTTSRLNGINVMVHPNVSPSVLTRLPGVSSVSPQHRFHSNMTRFPKRIHNGETKTAYGWQVSIDTLGGISSFLGAFDTLSL
ncbi:hypothetical protein [Caballeronia grimmiae]|uniref:hypothetical protein n=1 Tax=Caballeronia grimmiae TaxID=1071679 RepID=UPI0038BE1922